MADRPLTLSVVVISFNQADFLERLIGQLLTQDFPAERYEIIAVDDGSADGSREYLRSISEPRLKTVFGTENRGRSASRNAGIRAAIGDVIVMIDGDHTINPDFLSIHAEDHEREFCTIVGKSDFVDHPDFRALNAYLNNSGAAKMPNHTPLPGRYFLTRNCSVRKSLLLQVGLFDERFSAWGGEDLDLGVRLAASGIPVYGEPRALAVHHHLRPLNTLLEQMYIYGRDSIPLLLNLHPHLFIELNLYRLFPGDRAASPFSRFLMRALMSGLVYHPVRLFAGAMRRYALPRAVFDYLHLRQYSRGYRDHLMSQQ
jgi:glycosyltransferase involved in cell wall biosynthesis